MTQVVEKVTPKVGDILYSSWGYDQTNIEYFKVVKVSEFSVWIQPLKSKALRQVGWAHYEVVPSDEVSTTYKWLETGERIEVPVGVSRHKIQQGFTHNPNVYWVRLNSFSHATLWDGQPKTESHTA
jgi:hypothetical protein